MMPAVQLDSKSADAAVLAYLDIQREAANIVQRDPSAVTELKASLKESKEEAAKDNTHLKAIYESNAAAFKKMLEEMPKLLGVAKAAAEISQKLVAARGAMRNNPTGTDEIDKYKKRLEAARVSAVNLQTAADHFKKAAPAGFQGGDPAIKAYVGYVNEMLKHIHDGLPKLAAPHPAPVVPPRPLQGHAAPGPAAPHGTTQTPGAPPRPAQGPVGTPRPGQGIPGPGKH